MGKYILNKEEQPQVGAHANLVSVSKDAATLKPHVGQVKKRLEGREREIVYINPEPLPSSASNQISTKTLSSSSFIYTHTHAHTTSPLLFMDNSITPMVTTGDGLKEAAVSSKGRWRAAIFIICKPRRFTSFFFVISYVASSGLPNVMASFMIIRVVVVEMAERFAYYGVAGNLINYLTNELGEPTATAAKNVNVWVGVSAMFPLLGGFIADSYLGRFKTIIASSAIYLAVS